jgi:murein endopeptidase
MYLNKSLTQPRLTKIRLQFKAEVMDDIQAFQKETTLTIDVVAYPASFVFYHKGCDIGKMNLPDEGNSPSGVAP